MKRRKWRKRLRTDSAPLSCGASACSVQGFASKPLYSGATKVPAEGHRATRVIMATVGMFLSLAIDAKAINSNAIQLDGIEYYIQTDKTTYLLGENVEMLYRITNLGQQSVTYTASWIPIWNFWVESSGQSVWQGIHFKLAGHTSVTVEPGESVEFPDYSFTWNLRDDTGEFVQPGYYDMIGGIDRFDNYYEYTKVGVEILVIPEPATVALLGLGLPLLRKKHS